MLLDQGVTAILTALNTSMTNGEAGGADILFDASQTGVLLPIGSTDIALNTKTLSQFTINVSYLLSTSLGNTSIGEYEINDGSSNAYNRVIRPPITKTVNDELTIAHTFDFEVPQ